MKPSRKLPDFVEKPRRRSSLPVRQYHHTTPGGFHHFAADDLFHSPVATFGQDIRPDRPNQLQGGIFRKNGHIVDRLQAGYQFGSFPRRHNRPAASLEPTDRGVAVDPHNEAIGQVAGSLQSVQVAHMEKVKATVGEGDHLSLAPETADDAGKFFLRQNSAQRSRGAVFIDP